MLLGESTGGETRNTRVGKEIPSHHTIDLVPTIHKRTFHMKADHQIYIIPCILCCMNVEEVLLMCGYFFPYLAGTPQNPSSNSAPPTAAQQSTPPTASTGSVGGQQATPGSSLADITSTVNEIFVYVL